MNSKTVVVYLVIYRCVLYKIFLNFFKNTYSTAEILCDRAANTEKSLKSAPFDML